MIFETLYDVLYTRTRQHVDCITEIQFRILVKQHILISEDQNRSFVNNRSSPQSVYGKDFLCNIKLAGRDGKYPKCRSNTILTHKHCKRQTNLFSSTIGDTAIYKR